MHPPEGTNLALKKPYTCEPRPNYKGGNGNLLYSRLYDPSDATDLTDSVLATGGLYAEGKRPFVDDRWVVWTRDPKAAAEPAANLSEMQGASVTVDLGETRKISSIAVHLCSATTVGSPFPEVSLALSENGKYFVEAAATTAAAQGYLEPPGWPRVDWFVLRSINRRARYLRLNFAFGPKAVHLAVDEVAIHGE